MDLLHRRLRRTLTVPEQILWKELRNRQVAGFKFRRQHPIGPYVADFACIDARLVIELDGNVHDDRRAYDTNRTHFLQSQGYRVLRFRNVEIYRNLRTTLSRIREALTMDVDGA